MKPTMFSWGSSAVDWCESNYVLSIYVAEFFNTLSNLPVVLLPVIGLKLFKPYFKHVNQNTRIVFWLIFFVGISSTYFHATLSLFGQLLDEIAILWVAAAALYTWMPHFDGFPDCMKSNVHSARVGIVLIATVSSLLSFLEPTVNAYLLMALCPPALLLMVKQVKRAHNKTATHLGIVIALSWLAAFSVWMSDRFMCSFWKRIDFPYLHAIWHLLSAISSYTAVTLFSFVETLRFKPQLKPKILLWPKWQPLIPYIALDIRS